MIPNRVIHAMISMEVLYQFTHPPQTLTPKKTTAARLRVTAIKEV